MLGLGMVYTIFAGALWPTLRGPGQGTGQGLCTGGLDGSGSWKVSSKDSLKVLEIFRKLSESFQKVSGSFREQPVNNETRVFAGFEVHGLFTEASRKLPEAFGKLPEDFKNLPRILGRNVPASRAVQLPLAGCTGVP